MRLYSGSSRQFITDTAQNQIAGKLEKAFFDYYRYRPSRAEVNSWRESLRAASLVFEEAQLRDNGVIFAGIDVIGDFLTEINVTSPTGIRELDRIFNLNIAGTLFDAIDVRLG